MYGLKRAPRSWNLRFDRLIKYQGFEQIVNKPWVYKHKGWKGGNSNLVYQWYTTHLEWCRDFIIGKIIAQSNSGRS